MTARVRLALLYGLLFFTMGAALVAISYKLVSHNVPAERVEAVSGTDVVLRAAKLSQFSDVSETDRLAAADVAAQSPADALAFVEKIKPRFSTATYESLTSELAINVRTAALHQLLTQSLIALGCLTIASIALGWFVAGRVLRPLTRITETARRLSSANLDERIELKGPDDELTRLAAAFDDMLDRLAVSFEGQRRFVANASHELRTPLTIMATEIDVTLRRSDASADELRRMGTTVRTALDRSDRLITGLLALALVDEGLEVEVRTDMAMVVAESLERRAARSAAANLDVTTDLASVMVVGDPGLLDRLVDNLIENAINHNVDGGWIHVTTARDDTHAVVEVANCGAVVPDEAVESLFVPFRRLDGTTHRRESMGIGLSVVRAVARAHGGSASARARSDGGLHVTIRLPVDLADSDG